MTVDHYKKVAVIGAGAVGTALAERLSRRGYAVEAVISRTAEPARRLAERVNAPVASTRVEDLPEATRVLLCCVPDDAVAGVAEALAALPRSWSDTVVAHTSGALTSGVLAPVAQRGAHTLSFHPMQLFTPETPPEAFEGIYVGLEGDERALALGRQMALALGAHTVVIPPEAKTRYHLAASMASNFFVTLMALVSEVLSSAGIDQAEGAALVRPLVESTWRQLAHRPPEAVLTGPVARGDEGTVARHTAALTAHLPHLGPAYIALAVETVRVAVRGGKLAPAEAERLLSALHETLELRPDSLF